MATAAEWTAPGGWAGTWLGWMRGLAKTRSGGEAALRLQGRISLGPKKSLVLVECRGREVLLAVSGEAVTTVMDVSAPRRTRKAKP